MKALVFVAFLAALWLLDRAAIRLSAGPAWWGALLLLASVIAWGILL
jgi:hypothetical protein